MIRILSLTVFCIFNFFTAFCYSAGTVTYYINSTKGSDANDGINAAKPWQTIQRINRQPLQPGDSVLFARGEIFRGNLRVNSGKENHCVVYASYGAGGKPKLLGSIQRSKPSDWQSLGTNLWQTTSIVLDDKSIDVGNIIFGNEGGFGIKVPGLKRLNKQGVFWSDTANKRVVLYSTTNPAEHYSNIELALTRDIIKETYARYVTYLDLDLRYGGAHGIAGDSTHHIRVCGVDISYMGGGYLFGFDTTRYGNGVEFYDAANNNIVEKCRFSQIYDVALTSQGDKPNHEVYNLIFRNNIIDKCEQSFELWLRGKGSFIRNVYFENNTSTNAGYGIFHTQRSDKNGTFLLFWGFSDDVNASNIFVRNNIFSNSRNSGIYWYNPNDIRKMKIDNNCWDIKSGPIAKINYKTNEMQIQLNGYKSVTGHDQHSIFEDPKVNHLTNRLSKESPCINTGLTLTEVKDDHSGVVRERGSYDIGAYEYR